MATRYALTVDGETVAEFLHRDQCVARADTLGLIAWEPPAYGGGSQRGHKSHPFTIEPIEDSET